MKKYLIVSICIIAAVPVFASQKIFSIGGIWHAENHKTGGGIEIGFTLYQNRVLIRDCLTFSGFGGTFNEGNNFGELSIGNKVIVGGIIEKPSFAVIPYGFIDGKAGMFGTKRKKFFAAPFLLELNGGGGFELRFLETSGFFIEYGGGCLFTVGNTDSVNIKLMGYGLLSLGYRYYF